ncbi:hypothetical protein HII31_03934 [Pseudocercospora fuligena]|uniref:F-box domain-containing protein n=1 Tax=Pseudocercospora fuligena TaxID=685502 RepID=A0A8H6RP94_9PEZI|nr:hypothetical protein HII31_03934 [Pseudocercospora fuligena]
MLRAKLAANKAKLVTYNTSESETSSRFLDLPGELRNRIYRLALIQKDNTRIAVSSTGFERPALTRVNKQIRQESMPIFLYENKFTIDLPRFKTNSYLRFCLLVLKFKKYGGFKKMHINFSRSDLTPSWRDLLVFMYRVHQGVMPHFVNTIQPTWVQGRISPMFQLGRWWFGTLKTVYAMRKVEWGLVKVMVENHRQLLGTFDARWMQDGT